MATSALKLSSLRLHSCQLPRARRLARKKARAGRRLQMRLCMVATQPCNLQTP